MDSFIPRHPGRLLAGGSEDSDSETSLFPEFKLKAHCNDESNCPVCHLSSCSFAILGKGGHGLV